MEPNTINLRDLPNIVEEKILAVQAQGLGVQQNFTLVPLPKKFVS